MHDPRPRVESTPGEPCRVVGVRCTECGHPVAFARSCCPVCGSSVREGSFGPLGTVWSLTTVRIPVGERVPPYTLAYVDLDDGPRILGHVVASDGNSNAPVIGGRVRLRGVSAEGDPTLEVL
jgi:uncharacterized OB-fold protein